MNKRRRVALKKRRETRERLKAKEQGPRAGSAPASSPSGTRRSASS